MDEKVPSFVREYLERLLREMSYGMRIKFTAPLPDVVDLIMDQIERDSGGDS